jgi:bifunctional non-homologous end joining protein LigD
MPRIGGDALNAPGYNWFLAVPLPRISPARLARLRDPFDHADCIYEIKHDGFRGLAYIGDGKARLVSKNGNTFKSFAGLCDGLASSFPGRRSILDGEIVCLGPDGRALFDPLLYRRAEPFYYAFDCLSIDGRDLRQEPVMERKRILRQLIPPQPAPLLFVDHVVQTGTALYTAACEMDLEGVIAKWAAAPYGIEPPSVDQDQEPGVLTGDRTAGTVREDEREESEAGGAYVAVPSAIRSM